MGWSIVGDEFVDAGDSVVVVVDQRATGQGAGAGRREVLCRRLDLPRTSVIAHRSVPRRSDALEAAGLSE